MSYVDDLKIKMSKELPVGTPKGVFQGREYSHILPLQCDGPCAKRDTIKLYLGIDIDSYLLPESKYHQYIHHLTSSQLLCYNVFSRLLTRGKTNDNMVKLFANLNAKLHLNFEVGLDNECCFEYDDGLMWGSNMREGSKFDFHISGDDRSQELFIEAKFTEKFDVAKVKEGDLHAHKADFYISELKDFLRRKDGEPLTIKDIYHHYQIFRNVLRAKSIGSAAIFIYDGNCKESTSGVTEFNKRFSIDPTKCVKFLTWQAVKECWPDNIAPPFQFKYIQYQAHSQNQLKQCPAM